MMNTSFKTNIVDTMGAGDLFFAFASLCATVNNTEKLIISSPAPACLLHGFATKTGN